MNEITRMYCNDNQKFSDQINTVVKQLNSDKQRDDIEAILSILSAMADNTNVNILHYLARSHSLFTNLDITTAPDIIYDIVQYIYEKCRRPDFDKAVSIYKKLYDELELVTRFRLRDSIKREKIKCPINKNIFTTNYDPIIESFFKRCKIGYNDGFELNEFHNSKFIATWNQDKLNASNNLSIMKPEHKTNQINVQFGKLHGSIDYQMTDDGSIIKDMANDRRKTAYGQTISRRMMIFPIQGKYYNQSPYNEILYKLRSTLTDENVIVAIGYSFRDDDINQAFQDRIRRDSTKFKIVIIAPNATEILSNNIPTLLKKCSLAVNTTFGNEESVSVIREAVEERALNA